MLLGRLNSPGRVPPALQRYSTKATRQETAQLANTGARVTLRRRRTWTPIEQTHLLRLLLPTPNHPLAPTTWSYISHTLGTRTPPACRARILRLSRTTPEYAQLAQILQSKPNVVRRWTDEQEHLLVGLRLIGERGSWGIIARALGTRVSPQQCAAKYSRIMRQWQTQQQQQQQGGRNKDDAKCTLKRDAFNGTPVRSPDDAPVPRWSAKEEAELQRLVSAAGSFDFRRLSAQLPGFRYATMYRALRRLLNAPAQHKPHTPRGRAHRAVKWTDEEHARLVDAVMQQCRENTVVTRHPPPSLPRTMATASPLAMLFPQTPQGKLPALMHALSQDTRQHKAVSEQQLPTAHKQKIDWQQVSQQLTNPPRTAQQCRARWHNAQTHTPVSSSVHRNSPWSLEEDVQVYLRYLRAPRRWTWIAGVVLPGRTLRDVRRRVARILGYVEMLRGCRGDTWDPMCDGLVEVHERCEIDMWYNANAVGYRKCDPVVCPYDLDLTGINSLAQQKP